MDRSTPINPMDHIALVKSVLRQVAPNVDQFTWDDLFQEGMIGCIDAARKFDASKGYKFSSYAVPTISGYIRHYMRDKINLIRSPRSVKEPRQCLSLDFKLRGKDGNEYPVADIVPYPEPDKEIVEDVMGALHWLEQDDFESAQAITLTLGETDLMRKEAAKVIGVSPVTIARRVKRGVKKMQKLLEDAA
jgi:RNA polymerase sigma factor (sigma-70 family)